MKSNKFSLSRVDIQVSILTAIIVLISSFCVFYSAYIITYHDMIQTLRDRVNSIYSYIEESIDEETFYQINSISDFNSNLYKTAKEKLNLIRKATGVRYLYTAKENDAGEFIYIIDGLDYAAHDFRYPGDKIEVEIEQDLYDALNGKNVMPDEILSTEWGHIFITYLPVHNGNGDIVGVVGIEFDASHQYKTYFNIKIITVFSVLLFILISVIIAVYTFRRISNPNYHDLSNTDSATKLKNRNAFELDLQNIKAKKSYAGFSIISIDLNKLKMVNDILGHSKGDDFIKIVSEQLILFSINDMVIYRIGGDEFSVITKASESEIQKYIELVQLAVKDHSAEIGMDTTVSAGYAMYNSATDVDLSDTYNRADACMYENKRESRTD